VVLDAERPARPSTKQLFPDNLGTERDSSCWPTIAPGHVVLLFRRTICNLQFCLRANLGHAGKYSINGMSPDAFAVVHLITPLPSNLNFPRGTLSSSSSSWPPGVGSPQRPLPASWGSPLISTCASSPPGVRSRCPRAPPDTSSMHCYRAYSTIMSKRRKLVQESINATLPPSAVCSLLDLSYLELPCLVPFL